MPGKLVLTNQKHLRDLLVNKGWDPVDGKRWEVKEVIRAAKDASLNREFERVEDAMTTTTMAPLLPQTIVQIIKEAVEPLMIGPSLLDHVSWTAGQTITFPAVGALTAADVAEGQSYPEVQIQIGGSTVTATISKSGLAFSFTDEVLEYSNWDLMGLTMRKAVQALARHKEQKIFSYIAGMGVPTHDNLDPTSSIFGTCSGRGLNGAANGAAIMDDIFDAYAQVISQGFVPNTFLMHPLTWVMWMRDPVLRSFALASGGGTFFANYSGNPAGKAPWSNGPQGKLGMGTGQFITPGSTVSGDTPSTLDDYPQTINSAPQLPGYFPFPFKILVSPFVPFDPGRRTTDIYIFDSANLGALIVAEDLVSEEWDDPTVEMRKVKLRQRYGIGIYEEGMAIAVLRNVAIAPNEIVLPAQASISVSGSISDIDHFDALSI